MDLKDRAPNFDNKRHVQAEGSRNAPAYTLCGIQIDWMYEDHNAATGGECQTCQDLDC